MMAQEQVFNKQAVLSGLDLTKQSYQLLDMLIQTEDDYMEFWSHWCEMKEQQALAVAAFRNAKIHKNNVEFDQFKKAYLKDPVDALEQLFQHPVVEQDINRHMTKWFGKGSTLIDLYEEHKKNPYLTLFKIIL